MSETNETADKPTQGRKPLSLQRTVESGHVQQKFGQGRSKSVVVEKKRTRKMAAPSKGAATAKTAAKGRTSPDPSASRPGSAAPRRVERTGGP